MVARQKLGIATDNAAEIVFAARINGHCQVALAAIMIDQQFGIVDGGKRIAGFAEGHVEVGAFLDDGIALEEIARLNFESAPEFDRVGGCREIPEIDAAIGVPFARDDIEADHRLAACRILPRLDPANRSDDAPVVIPVNAQQVLEQRLVLVCPGANLREVVRNRCPVA